MDTNTDKLYLVSDYSPYITLQGMLMRTGRLDIAKAKDYFKQILAALYYCYTAAGVIHRNITLENIVVMEDNDCPKLMELGQAFLIENEDSDTSEEYIAPELKDKSKYKSAQTDVWALGTCLYCMIEGCTPLTSESNQIKTLKQEPKFHYTKDPELQDLLKSMLAKDPSKRIKLKQINVRLNINHQTHSWVNNKAFKEKRNGSIVTTEAERTHAIDSFETAKAFAKIKHILKAQIRYIYNTKH